MQKRRKAWADRHGKQKVFSKGDHVLIFNSKLGKHPGKLKLRWIGPCTIEEEMAPGAFVLRNLDGTLRPGVVNGCRMKPYHGARQPIAPPQVLSIRCEPMPKDSLRMWKRGTTVGTNPNGHHKEKEKKTQGTKRRERPNGNDEITINDAANDYEIAINIEESNDAQINDKTSEEITQGGEKEGTSKYDTTEAASTERQSSLTCTRGSSD